VLEALRQACGDALTAAEEKDGVWYLETTRERVLEVCRFLATDPGYLFTYPMDLTAVDDGAELRVLYVLFSLTLGRQVQVTVRLPVDDLRVPSVAAIWPGQEWNEREAYDLFGIQFEGHPDLRRVLLPEDWVGHPLRKSVKLGEKAGA
jgi:NADH-quinone oxidoreductase subunit C